MNVSLFKYNTSNPVFKYLLQKYFLTVKQLYLTIKDKTSSIIELGCGEGYSTAELLKFFDSSSSFKAFDINAEAVAFARKKNPGVLVEQSSIENLEPDQIQADLLILLEVLEHVQDPTTVLKKLQAMSQKYLIIGIPNEPLWRICNCLRGAYLRDFGNTPGHINHWNAGTITALVEEHYGPVLQLCRPLPWIILLAKNSKSTT